ncbi:MAG: hypothetical protein QG562_332, partial [Patescibacteria group bacterium]|nr:hypothetical protein [Patescibacteria group bacterium]
RPDKRLTKDDRQ